MEKIATLFERDWEGDRTVVDRVPEANAYAHEAIVCGDASASEKLDGTNVRLTVRNHELVRLEARLNPTKAQKARGIVDPWYRDAWLPEAGDFADQDKHIVAAARGTQLAGVPDGEWSGEAIGPKIQGNPLGLIAPMIVLFSLGHAPPLKGHPTDFEGLRDWLLAQRSAFNPDRPIEGIVWTTPFGMVKLKAKDFR